ncbi:type II toxin-antitoxin system HipA family toxin [Luteococcus sp. H138]|uniref:type II toxin-antitoxin system HipA family toxin n=1 Tax=unclassified Luteococcus TaxID=2639923 RepID=UPI00313EFEA4
MSTATRVHVDLDGHSVEAGTLYVQLGRTVTTTFVYSPAYLVDPRAYPIEPAFPLVAGPHPSAGLPHCVADTAPDRWGRNLIRKRLRATGELGARGITDLDYLLGVSDATRQGALRFSRADGPFLATHVDVPKTIALPRLLRAAEKVAGDEDDAAEIKVLLDAGTASLGGARPKASVADGDVLHIAKFPHPGDSWDVMAWETTALDLAERAGVDVPAHRLTRVEGRSVLLSRRFDRSKGKRVGYLSAMTLLGADDGDERDYLEIAEELALNSAAASADLAQLWRRIAFGLLINNTDDHLRNHGVLRTATGWRLSPAFDLNPNPEPGQHATTILGEAAREPGLEALMVSAPQFGLDRDAAARILGEVRGAVAHWRTIARGHGIRAAECELMATAFGC